MWIETKDRLPPNKNIPVIVSCQGMRRIDFMLHFQGSFYYMHDGTKCPFTIIAWFDLPKYVPSADQLIEELGY